MNDQAASWLARSAAKLKALAIPLALLIAVPAASLLGRFVPTSHVLIFLTAAGAIGVLADWVRRATDQLSARVGPALGSLLNVSFGSIAELILAFFVLASGAADVVRAQLTGSIIGTSLFGLGIAIVVGSLYRQRQLFNRKRAGHLASLLIMVVIALLLPGVFDLSTRYLSPHFDGGATDGRLSIAVSFVMLGLYAANLVYVFVAKANVFASDEVRDTHDAPGWPLWISIGILILATALIAFEAQIVSAALKPTAKALGLSPVFMGVIVLALVGTASDLFVATWYARRGKLGLALNICVGSAVQVALVVAPLLVLGSWLLSTRMSLVFRSPLDLFAIASAALIVNMISGDGEATWFEGVLLLGVYVLLAIAFFFSAPVA